MSTREALSALIEEARTMSSNIDDATIRYHRLSSDTSCIQRVLDCDLKSLVISAVDGMDDFGRSVVDLFNVPDQDNISAKTSLIAKCKGQGHVLARKFEGLHQVGQNTLRRAGDVAIEATNAASMAEKQLKRIDEMLQISSTTLSNAETVKRFREHQIEEAARSIEDAEQSKQELERRRHDIEVTRLVRNIFTFGFGELGDWGGINAAVDHVNMLIASSGDTMRASQDALQEAQADLQRIQDTLSKCQDLRGNLYGHQGRVLEQERLTCALRDQLNTVQNNSLDVSRYLSVLAAKSTTVQLELPAQQLAQKVLALQESMGVERPRGLFWDRPQELQRTLEAIASSPVPAIDVGDMM